MIELIVQRSGATLPDLDRVILDYRVGEQLPAHLFDLCARQHGVRLGEIELDELALPNLADPGEAQALQRIADRLALRIEHPGFEADVDSRLHGPGTLIASSWAPRNRPARPRAQFPAAAPLPDSP